MTQTFQPQDMLVEVEQLSVAGCMDERIPELDCQVLGNVALYAGWPGGMHGLAKDVATASETTRPGSFTNLNIPMTRYAKELRKLLYKTGIDFSIHHACAALLGSDAVESTLAAPHMQTAVHNSVTTIDPEIAADQSLLESTLAARVRVQSTPRYGNSRAVFMTLWKEDEHNAGIPAAHLHGDHTGEAIVVNDIPDTVMDRRAAARTGSPLYVIDRGLIVPAVIAALETEVDLDARTLSAAGSTHIAGVREHLPVPKGIGAPPRLPLLRLAA